MSEPISIGYREVGVIDVPANTTMEQSEPVVIGDGGTFVKTGEGTLKASSSVFDRSTEHKLVVSEGTLQVSVKGSSGTSEVTPPSCIASKAAFWVDVSADNGSLVLDGNVVTKWCDRRETNFASPTRYYALPANTGVAGGVHIPQTYVCNENTNAVYFGGYNTKNDAYMRYKLDGRDARIGSIYHAYAVHGVFDAIGGVLGSLIDPMDFFAGSVIRKSTTDPSTGYHFIFWGHLEGGAFTGRHYLDGERIDPYTYGPKIGFQLYEAEYIDQPGAFDSFYTMRTSAGRQGGDYLSEVILFTNRLTSAERLSVERYLMKKWNLGYALMQDAKETTALVDGASVAVAVDGDDDALPTLALEGPGAFLKLGSGRLNLIYGTVFSLAKEVETHLGMSEAFVNCAATPTLKLAAGERVTASVKKQPGYAVEPLEKHVLGGVSVAISKAAGPDEVMKVGTEEVTIRSLPDDVRKITVNEGQLTIAGKPMSEYVQGAPMPVKVSNGDFEIPKTPNYNYNLYQMTSVGESIEGWTLRVGPKAGIVIENRDEYTSRSTFSPFPIAQGKQAFVIVNKAWVSTTVHFDHPGRYVLSYLELSRFNTSLICDMAIAFGKTWDTRKEFVRRLANYGNYTRVYFEMPEITEAGDYELCFGSYANDTALMLDDVRIDPIITVRADEGVVSVPNGGFEETITNGFTASWSIANQTKGWTFSQTASIAGYPGVAVTTLTTPSLNPNNLAQSNVRLGDMSGWQYGSAQLTFASNIATAVSEQFTVPAGTYHLRGRIAKWSMNFAGSSSPLEGNPRFKVVVTTPTGSIDLGETTTASHLMDLRIWPNAFTLASAGKISLSVAQSDPMAIGLLDDLELIVAVGRTLSDEDKKDLLKDGGLEAEVGVNWSKIPAPSGSSVADINRYANYGAKPNEGSYWPSQWGATPYEGKWFFAVRNDCGISQTITIPRSGLYRLSLGVHSRVSPAGYERNPIRAYLIDGNGREIPIGWTTADAVNWVKHEWDFRIDTAGTYTICIQGMKYEPEEGIVQWNSMIDGASLKMIPDNMALPEISKWASVEVADGARLRLDFDGAIKVQSMKYAGRQLNGSVSAASYPEFIQGRGRIEVQATGAYLIYR